MKGSRLLIALLLLATVLVDAVVLTIAAGQEDFPSPTLFLAWALQISQVSLMAIWLALGATPGPWRLMGVVGGAALWAWVMSTLPDAPTVGGWAASLTAQTIAVSVPLLVARSLGLAPISLSAAEQAENSTTGAPRFQFSIRYLLGWMTALAVMLGTLKSIAPFDSSVWGWPSDWTVVLFLSGNAVIALAALWAALGTRWPATRIIVLLLISIAPVGTLWVAEGRVYRPGYLVMLYTLEAFLLLGSLWVFRVAGYRLSFRGLREAPGK